MGNSCCKVKNYIDEEEYRNPFETIETKEILSKHMEIIEEDIEDDTKRNYSIQECIIENNIIVNENVISQSIEYLSIKEDKESSIDVVSESSILSYH